MSIVYKDVVIPGRLLRFELASPESQIVISRFWGVHGASAIHAATAERPIELPFLLFNDFPTREKLEQWIKDNLTTKLQNQRSGTLKIPAEPDKQPSIPFDDCVLLKHIVMHPGPLPGGNLIGVDDDGWFCFLMLLFVQLKV